MFNGKVMSLGEVPLVYISQRPPADPPGTRSPITVKVVAFNIAKCFAHRGGVRFESRDVVAQRLERLAAVIRSEQPDVLFLSEVITDCGPCPVNHLETLADALDMHTWAFGENYNFGLPFYRVVGGNAILSRWPIEPVGNPSLAGRKPFYVTKNNRRVLWCAMRVAGRRVLLASVHNDSFDPKNNLRQAQQILDFGAGQDVIMAGDFNAQPGEPSIELIRASARFAGRFEGPPTFPADAPTQRIDFIFAPSDWELLDERVLDTQVSDHRPVVATFRVP